MCAEKGSTKQVRSTYLPYAYLCPWQKLIPTALYVINNNFSKLSLMIIHHVFLEHLHVSSFALGFLFKILLR